jgi:ribosomal subunit interface protein
VKRFIELKHVRGKETVRTLLHELIDRLEERLQHFAADAVSVHAVFEENGSRTLFRSSVTCHLPKHVVAAHEEGRDAGLAIRKTFAEIERQLEKQKAIVRHEHQLRRSRRNGRAGRATEPGLEGGAES